MNVPATQETEPYQSPFIEKTYESNRNFLKAYHYLAARYLSIVYGWDYENLLEICEKVFVPNENGFKEAKFGVFKKDKYGDRVPTVMGTREFFNAVRENNWHLSPSLVAYTNTEEEQSVNAAGTEEFIEFRRLYKGKKQAAKDVGDEEAEKAFHEIQNALKIFNNSQSGGMSSSGTPLFNKSGHTTLTSTCRALTSTANLINERLITGNRLLLTYNKTMELFISQLQFADRDLIQSVIDEYGMAYATVDQVMDMVRRCTAYYWDNPVKLRAIEQFLRDLTPLELTIILCTQDLRGLYTTNPDLIKRFFKEWCDIPEFPEGVKEEDHPKPLNGDYYILCLTKLGEKSSKAQINFLNGYHLEVEKRWGNFISAFLKSSIPPTDIYSVKELVRENVMTSDTDACIYSVDQLIQEFSTDPTVSLRFNGVLTFFIRNIAIDQHAKLSRNMNVAKKYERRLNMKNEYLYASYVTTSMSKHYFALQLMVEGVLNKKPKLDLKGVHLRGVKIAELVRKFTGKLMRKILDALYTREKLDAPKILREVADIERQLFANLEEGGWAWLAIEGVKDPSAYTDPESNERYINHLFWDQVLAPKYGDTPPFPYKAYKINLTLTGKKKLEDFFNSIEDPNYKALLTDHLKGRDKLSSIYIPTDQIDQMGGIPKEFIPFIDKRRIVSHNLKSIYAILEALGLFILNAKVTRLVSDEH